MHQARNYCFTDFELLKWGDIYAENKDIIRYICWGEEVCPSTKKKHYQGWIQFYNKKRLGGIKRMCRSKKIHLEACYGNEYDNQKYCTKDGAYTALGKFITQGHRSDLEDIQISIKDGNKIKDIMDNHFETYCKYRNGIIDYKKECDKERAKEERKVEVIILSGTTGTGKTMAAMKEATYKIDACTLNWWDGYEGDKCICIDDYDNDVNITRMLTLLDRYTVRLPIKGGFTYAMWDKVYITTNLKKEEIHCRAKERHIKAFWRRVTEYKELCAEVAP